MSEQAGETVLLDKLTESPFDYAEDGDTPDGLMRLREEHAGKKLMMTDRYRRQMVEVLGTGSQHRAEREEFVQSMIGEFGIEVIYDA
jgi:hypothetical protein